jgi:phosphatidylinositol alpha 1,6-mannosyltransferase
MAGALEDFAPDVVHLASPAVLGAQAAFTARRLGLPVVAVYQTDLAGFAGRYGLAARSGRCGTGCGGCTAPPAAPRAQPARGRRAAAQRRRPRGPVGARRRPAPLRAGAPRPRAAARLAPDGELLVGYVGRLAQEKEVGLLTSLRDLPGVRLVVAGDGPRRAALQAQLPGVPFVGFQGGAQLAATFASLDVFVHTGAHETFCQAAQEALASGVPSWRPRRRAARPVEDGVNGLHFAPGSGSGAARRRARAGHEPGHAADEIVPGRSRESVAGRTWEGPSATSSTAHYEEVA